MDYPGSQRPAEINDKAFKDFSKSWRPPLDFAETRGYVFGYQLPPASDVFDGTAFDRGELRAHLVQQLRGNHPLRN